MAATHKLKAILTSSGELKLSKEELISFYNTLVIPEKDDSLLKKKEDVRFDEQEIEVDVYLHKKIITRKDFSAGENVNIDIDEVEFLSRKLSLDKNSTSSFLKSFGSLKLRKNNL